jgi:RNA polymerase sigma factor (sigma-70 family)
MEVSALKYHGHGSTGLHGRSPLLRLRSDEQLIALLRRGNTAAFEVLLSRYESRLLAFCRHLLGSREDAEDVLQEVMTAAFNAIVADDRPINVRPWLYRIARNRSLNHLRRTQAIAVDTMDYQLSEHGATTADKVHEREEFRLLVGDIHDLPETQKTALVLREMDAMSYEQIAEAMETTVSSVKSLLVRARLSLAEAAEARALSCEEVRIELAEVAEGLLKRPSPLVKRHLKGCERCNSFRAQLKHTNKALAALLPVGPLVVAKKFALIHFGHSATTAGGSGATAAGGATAASGGGALAGAGAFSGGSGFVSAGLGAVATKAAAGLAAAALVTAGAVEVNSGAHHHHHRPQPVSNALAQVTPPSPAAAASSAQTPAPASPAAPIVPHSETPSTVVPAHLAHAAGARTDKLDGSSKLKTTAAPTTSTPTDSTASSTTPTGPVATIPTTPTATTPTPPATTTTVTTPPGRTVTQTSPSMPSTTNTITTPPPVVLPPMTTAPPTITTTPAPTISTTPSPTVSTPEPTTPAAPTTSVPTATPTAPVVSTPTVTRPPGLTTGTIGSPPPAISDPLPR